MKKTEGCLRAYDKDMIAFKSITDELQKKDSEEFPGVVTILDDLERITTPHPTKYIETVSTYKVPEPEEKEKRNYWDDFFNSLNNRFVNWYNW